MLSALSRNGFGTPHSVDALFAQINVMFAPNEGYKIATLGSGEGYGGLRGDHYETENYFLPLPNELDCSCVILAR